MLMLLIYLSLFPVQIKILWRSWGSSVSIVSGYRLDDRAIEVRSPAEIKDFSSILCVQTGYRGYFAEGKVLPGRDDDHSSPSSAEVKNE
jgi:hypothetical protein